VTIGLSMASIVVIALLSVWLAATAGEVESGTLGTAAASTVVDVVTGWEAVNLFVTLFAAASFVAWQSRAVANVPWLGGGTPPISPGWAIGWWLIPIADLFMPYRSIADLERRTAIGAPRTALVAAWWLLFIGGNLADRVISVAMVEATSVSDLSGLVIADLVALAAVVLSGALAISVVLGIEHSSAARAAQVGVVGGSPVGAMAARGPAWGGQGGAEPTWSPPPAVPTAGGPGSAAAPADPTAPPVAAAPAPATGSAPIRPDIAVCPWCGRRRASPFRYCVACGFDFMQAG
jgi:hypothetical protein